MHPPLPSYAESGLEVLEVQKHPSFLNRKLHRRDISVQMESLRLLCHAFLESPDTMLQEVVDSGIHLCGADSAGISLAQPERGDDEYFLWVAVAGEWSSFANTTLPRYPSPCGVCVARGTPQIARVGKRFFDLMGIDASPVTDSLLLPWEIEGIRGTIWLMAHGRTVAFDSSDLRTLQALGDFAKLAIRRKIQDGAQIHEIGSLANLTIGDSTIHGNEGAGAI